MNITFTSKKGRSTISNSIDVEGLQDEEDLQEVFLEFFYFLQELGANIPEELLEEIESYDGSD